MATFGAGGNGGNANALASAASLVGPANTTAQATGGASGLGLSFTPVAGGAANATANATGLSGLATAMATTPGNAPLFPVAAQSTGTVASGSTTSANAATNAGGAFLAPVAPFNNTAPNSALATAVGMPDRASLNAALAGDPNNFAKWSPPSTFVAGEGLLGAIAPGGIAHSFDTKVDFTFMIPSGYGSTLTIGLLNGAAFNAAAFDPSHDSLTLTITDNANVIFSDSFLSLTDAVNFFTDDVLTLGTIYGVSNDIGIDLMLVSSDNVGFQGSIVVGTVPEPASWLLFGTGLVLLIIYGRRSRRTSMAA
jgi:hypothetical protein